MTGHPVENWHQLAALLCLVVPVGAGEDDWAKVQHILANTHEVVVLDKTERSPSRQPDAGPPEQGDWWVGHLPFDPITLNPITYTDVYSSQVLSPIVESLLELDPDPPHQLRGRLAKQPPEVSADKLTYTFDLRSGVRFSDGQPFTAEDMLFSMKAVMNPRVVPNFLCAFMSSLKDVRVAGEHRVIFEFSEPYFLSEYLLGLYIPPLPKHFYDPEGLLDPVEIKTLIDGSWEKGPHADRVKRFAEHFNQDFSRKILATGPYILQDPERDLVTQQKVVLTRNPAYWGNGVTGVTQRGHLDKLVFKIINNADAAFVELVNGNLDQYALLPLQFKEKCWTPDFNAKYLIGVEYIDSFSFIAWNNRHPIFSDRRVRQAMTCMMDRQKMAAELLFGLGKVVEGPINRLSPEYNDTLKAYIYDPERAQRLLSEAGWTDSDGDGVLDKVIDGKLRPFDFEMILPSGAQVAKDIALVLQQELRDIGVVCRVREMDGTSFIERHNNHDYEALYSGLTKGNAAFPPDWHLTFHSSQAGDQGSNLAGFKNAEADRILEEYRREFDLQKRISLYWRLQEILSEEQPFTFLFQRQLPTAYSRRFQGVNWYPWGVDPTEWWVKGAERVY